MRALIVIVVTLVASAMAFAADVPTKDQKQAAPEAATSGSIKPLVIAQKHMVVAANPYAAEAGRAILRQGGSAMDAAIAVQLVLNLVEPQSSGIGGGAFILAYDAKTKQVDSIDGRETAPMAAKPDRFLLADGKERPFDEAVNSGLSTGVPGVIGAFALGHRTRGKLAWAKVFEPAIALAETGFTVSPRLAKLLAAQGPDGFSAEAKALYFDAAGKPRQAGETLRNPAFAETLRALAAGGADAFYKGQIAMQILRELAAAPHVPGDMTAADLSGYSARERNAVCVGYRSYRVCGMGPPSSGGTTVAMVLGMLEARTSASPPDLDSPSSGLAELLQTPDDTITRAVEIAEAEKLAYADRDQYIADPDFVPQPSTLTDPGYLAARAKLIDPAHPMTKATPGTPPMKTGMLYGTDATNEHAGTSHISIVDGEGNAVSMTIKHRDRFRFAADGGRLPAQQSAHRFLVQTR